MKHLIEKVIRIEKDFNEFCICLTVPGGWINYRHLTHSYNDDSPVDFKMIYFAARNNWRHGTNVLWCLKLYPHVSWEVA